MPIADYCVQVWNPRFDKHCHLVDNAFRRATKICPQISDLDYERRLTLLGITNLKDRCLRGDLLEIF